MTSSRTRPRSRPRPAALAAGHGARPRAPYALLVIDFVNPLDFPGAQDLATPALAAARATARLAARVREGGGQVIFANDNYGLWHSEFQEHHRRCRALPGVPGALARLLAPRADDIAILKPRHSAFFATPLDLILQDMRCRRLIVTGLATDNCILFTAMDAYVRGYRLWVPADCTAAEGESAKQGALEHMRRVLKAETRPALAPASSHARPAR